MAVQGDSQGLYLPSNLFTIYSYDIVLHYRVHYFHLFFYVLMTHYEITDPFVCKLGI